MKRADFTTKIGIIAFVTCCFLGTLALPPAYADKLAVPLGKSINLKLSRVTKLMAVKEGVVEVLNVSNDEVIIAGIGGAPDATQLIVWDSNGRTVYDVETYSEKQLVQEKFASLFPHPGVTVQMFPDSAFLRGQVSSVELKAQAQDVLSKLVNGLPIMNLIDVTEITTLKERLEKEIGIPTVQVTIIDAANLSSGTTNVATLTAENRIILEGTVKNQNDFMRMVEVVRGYVRDQGSISNMVKIEDPIQVVFQTYVLHVKKDKDRELGILWGSSAGQGTTINTTQNLGTLKFFENPMNAFRGGDTRTLGAPVDNWPNPFKFNPINRFDIVGAIVKGWEQKSLAKVLSNPKLMVYANASIGTRNKMAGTGWTDEASGGQGAPGEGLAYVRITRRIPYLSAPDNSGIRSPNFVEADLALSIRDLYVDGDNLKFSVYAQQDDVVGIGDSTLPPQVERRNLTTTVRIKDEETVVLGGLITKQTTKSTVAIPVLSKLPYIGRLFKDDHTVTNEAELVILLTPKVTKKETTMAGNSKFEVVPVPKRSDHLENLHNLFQDIKKSHFPENKKE